MNIVLIIGLPIIGALIGWITNKLAIHLLFHPRKPKFGIQGLIPKRQGQIAEKVADVVSEKLLDDPLSSLGGEEGISEFVTGVVLEEVKKVAKNKPCMALISSFFIDASKIKDLVQNKVEGFVVDNIDSVKEKLDVRTQIVRNVQELELNELEKVVKEITKKELRAIEILGGVLGLIVGIFQVIIIAII